MKEQYMLRAIELAKKGKGKVNPNPLVGAVIVKDNKIIGEGYHEMYGGLHAERNSFKNLIEDARGADMYVTLEPCCHYGKQPPCTDAIIEHGIKKVYIGSNDPNKFVCGKGIQKLKDANIEVVTEFMKKQCDELNPIFFHYITTKTPYVIMKYAMTLDGKIATYKGHSKWITSDDARNLVHQTRNELMGIMVGINTVLKDNPMLNCRIENARNPIRIICDSNLNIPLDSNIVKTANIIPTYVATCSNDTNKTDILLKNNVNIIKCNKKDSHVDLNDLMIKLGELNIDSILLEGGGELNFSALKQNIVNHVQVYIAPKIFGGKCGYTPVSGIGVEFPEDAFEFTNRKIKEVGEDILLEFDIKKDRLI